VRTGRLDVEVFTGAQWTVDVQLVKPGTPVAVETALPGRWYLDGVPVPVHSVRDMGNGWVALQLGDGLYGEPSTQIPVGSLIAPAEPVVALDAAAGFAVAVPGVGVDDPPTMDTIEIPATISPDGATVTLQLDADATVLLSDSIGAYSWDLYVQTAADDWQRCLEGTFTISKGDAR